jgi:N-acetyl sugar amidotransferase
MLSQDNQNTEWGNLAPRGLPNKIQYCKKCVISNQKPISSIESKHSISDKKEVTHFTDGVCDACKWAQMKEKKINWNSREKELRELCDKYRSNSGEYDVVVPASGGKDSRYVAHLLKTEYGMNPLTVTWKPHIYTDVGLENLISMINNGFPNFLVSPNGQVQKKLCQLAFKNLGHPFQPFIIGQRVVGPKLAIKHKIKLVFYGENVAEYGNRIEDNLLPTMDPRLFTCFNFNSQNLEEFKIAGLTLKELISNHNFSFNDLLPYRSPSLEDINKSQIETHYMSYYKKWVPQDNYYYAAEKTGFILNPKRRDGSFSRYAGLDDVMEDLHYYMQVIKFGMGRCTWDTAQEIRTNKLERDEGVALVRKYDQEPPTQFLDEILEYLELTEDEFWMIINQFRTPHLWVKNSEGKFILNSIVS